MKRIAVILLCCGILLGFTNFSQAQPKNKDAKGSFKNQPGGKGSGKNRSSGNGPGKNRSSGNGLDLGRSSDTGSGAGAAYFYSSNAFRMRKIYPDGTLLLVSETKGYDWNIKQYYDVLEKVELIGLRLPNPQDVCYQEYFDRLQQLTAAMLLYVEYDKSVQPSDINVHPAYVWTKDGQLINLQVIREGYVAAQALDGYKYQVDFLAVQDIAQQQQRGIWSSEKQHCAAVPLPAVQSVSSPFKTNDKQTCRIKGLISSDGTLKYCLSPGDKNYDAISVRSTKGERWFCSKEDARKAGWACY